MSEVYGGYLSPAKPSSWMVPVLDRYFEIYKAIFRHLKEKIVFPDTPHNRAWLAGDNSPEFNGFCMASKGIPISVIEDEPGLDGIRMNIGYNLWKNQKKYLNL